MGSSPSREKIYSVDADTRKFYFDGKKWAEYCVDNGGHFYRNESNTIFIGVFEMFRKLGFKTIMKNNELLKMVKESDSKCVQAVLNMDITKEIFTFDILVTKDFKCVASRYYNPLKYSIIHKYEFISDKIQKTKTFESGRDKCLDHKITSLNNFDLLQLEIVSNEKTFYVIEFKEDDLLNNVRLITDNLDKV